MNEDKSSRVCGVRAISKKILVKIFVFLNPKSLTRCRAVCRRWQRIVDFILKNELLWLKHCKTDYKNVYHSACVNSLPRLSWYRLYKSLTLWAKLNHAQEKRNEITLTSFNVPEGSSLNFQLLPGGIMGVLTNLGIEYFNITTLMRVRELSIRGCFIGYRENEEVILILDSLNFLSVRRTETRNIVHCEIRSDDDCIITELVRSPSTVLSLGYENGTLYILTSQFTVCSFKGNVRRTVPFADSTARGKCEVLRKYNLVNQIDWISKVGKIILIEEHKYEYPFLKDLVILRTHGPVLFAVYKHCILRIYYSLYNTPIINLLGRAPLKLYNMSLYASPRKEILNIDVVEGEDNHTLLVLLCREIVLIKFTYSSKSDMWSFEEFEGPLVKNDGDSDTSEELK